MKRDLSNLRRYIRDIIKVGKFKILIAFLLMLCVAILSLLQPQLILGIIDKAIPDKNKYILVRLIGLYVLTSLIICVFNYILRYIYSVIRRTISVRYKNELLNHLMSIPIRLLKTKKSGEVLKVLEDDVFNIENFGIDTAFDIISQIITAAIALYFLLTMQPLIFFVVLLIEVVEIIFQYYNTKRIAKKTGKVREVAGECFSILEEIVTNLHLVIISKCKLSFWKKLISEEKIFKKNCIELDTTIEMNRNISNFLHIILIMSIYLIGGLKVIQNTLSLGTLIVYMEYVNMFTGPIYCIIRMNAQIQQLNISLNNIYELLDTPPDIVQDNHGIRMGNIVNNIRFENVSFSYNDDVDILKKINMTFPTGSVTGIVGNTGCGKTTIIKLLYRLWDINSGRISIDNIAIQDYNLYNIRKQISIVSQDIFAFNDTIWNNIVGTSKKEKNEVLEICKAVGVDEFVAKMQKGYDTVIGERGARLSGGQKQKIALARALVSGGKVLILDEATAALDNVSQNKVIRNLLPYLKNKITIIIAHRLETIKNADQIYVLNDGKCVGNGSHDMLLRNCQEYKELYAIEKKRKYEIC